MPPEKYLEMCVASAAKFRAELIGKRLCKLDSLGRINEEAEECQGIVLTAETVLEEFAPKQFQSRTKVLLDCPDGARRETYADLCADPTKSPRHVFADQCKAI